MQTITTIGLDIAKSVFQVHGVDATGQVVIRRQLKRRYVLAFFQKLSPCLSVPDRASEGSLRGVRPTQPKHVAAPVKRWSA
jgi:transposase